METTGRAIQWRWDWATNPTSNIEWIEVGDVMRLLQQVKVSGGKDSWVWANNEGQKFSTKSIRWEIELFASVPSDVSLFKWNPWAPLKVNYLGWRAELGKVAAKTALERRGVVIQSNICSRCGLEPETSDHIFVKCIWARSVWWCVFRWMRIPVLCEIDSVSHILEYIATQIGSKTWKKIVHMVVLGCLWRIWLVRNEKEFNCNMIPVPKIIDQLKEETFLWLNNRASSKVEGNKWVEFDICMIM
ncbi:putative reverse transcriptase zinc-binding domain-containing protein [Helianthus annuus]|nr:putative reverse transcriptase zinc-binding domain-containing protein [Helianthus annuus]KAJ0813333.1 putative reverse transcriptase zinc-binding domain-containing protein [Helianthus annuus]